LVSYNELEYENEFVDDDTDYSTFMQLCFHIPWKEAYNHKWSLLGQKSTVLMTQHIGGTVGSEVPKIPIGPNQSLSTLLLILTSVVVCFGSVENHSMVISYFAYDE
jgi:hypothetical protein